MSKEFYESETKKSTKGLKKKAIALGLVSAVCAVLAGCGLPVVPSGNQNSSQSSSGSDEEIIDSGNASSETPNSSEEITPPSSESSVMPPDSSEEKESDPIPYDEIADFIYSLKTENYLYAKPVDDEKENIYYSIDGDITKVWSPSDRTGKYYYTEDNKFYVLEYDATAKKWNKYYDEDKLINDSLIYDTLVSTNWTFYDADAKTATGTSNGKEYTFNLEEQTFSGDVEGAIVGIGYTSVKLPKASNIVDKTTQQEAEDTSNKLYTIAEGVYTFNIVEMQDPILAWMQGKNQYGKDMLAEKWANTSYKTEEIPYVKASKDKIEFGFVYSKGTEKGFRSAAFEDDTLYEKIKSGEIETKNEFVSYLNVVEKTKLDMIRDSVVIDTEVSAEEFDALTKNVFQRLEDKGTQGTSINNDNPETKLADFSNATVLYGFKSTAGEERACYDIGYNKGWKQCYVINYNGNIEFIEINVSSATANGVSNERENVLENNESWWLITSIQRETINAGNANLYNSATA